MLKCAGYDHLVITGRAEKPCYLKISDEEVEVCDASDLWGKDLYDTCDELTARHKGATGKCGVWAIGRSGEKLAQCDHIGESVFGQPFSPDDKFIPEVSEMRHRSPEAAATQLEESSQDFKYLFVHSSRIKTGHAA